MPTVPQIKDTGAQLQGLPNARFGADTSLETFGGGQSQASIGQGLEKIADTTLKMEMMKNRLAAEEKRKADQLAFIDMDKDLSAYETRAQYDPKTGFTYKKGKDAFGLPDAVKTDWDKTAEEIGKRAANPEQKLMFERSAKNRWANLDQNVQRHVGTQIRAYDDETTKSFIDNERDSATSSYLNPEQVDISIQRQQAAIIDYANRNGLPQEYVKNKIVEESSKTHAQVIDRMLSNGQDMLAKSYYEKVKNQVAGRDSIRIEKDLETGILRGESQRLSDRIVGEYSDLEGARAAVKEIKDPKLRDETDQRVKQEFSIREGQANIQREKLFMDATSTVEQTRSTDNISPSQWNALLPNQRAALRTLQENLNKEGPHKHDDAVFLKYYGMPQKTLAKVSEAELIEKVRINVDDPAYNKIATKWQAAREAAKGDKKKDAEVKSIFNDQQNVLNALANAGRGGIKPGDTMADLNKKGSERKAKVYLEMSQKADAAFMSFFHANGKMPNDEQKQQILDKLIIKEVTVKNIGWLGIDRLAEDVTKEVTDLTDDEAKRIIVPKDEREKIESALKRANRSVDEETVSRMYVRKLRGK